MEGLKMNELKTKTNELFTSTGKLKSSSPKKYECKSCSHISNKTKKVNTYFAGFAICENCGGSVKERAMYDEWVRRNNGQWEEEKLILEMFKENNLVYKDDIYSVINSSSSALGNLVYNGYLLVDTVWKECHGEIRYKINNKKNHNSILD
jgi:hypothetical protein